jgi:hypothetical protein
VALVSLAASCGPESYRPGNSDAHLDLHGTGGVSGGTGGGSSGTGGGSGTGGMGAGGAAGSCIEMGNGGVSGDAGLPQFLNSWTFDGPDLQAWILGGTPSDLVAGSREVFDDQHGSPSPGSARVTIPFTAANQQIAFEYNFAGPTDLSGKTMTARLRVNSCDNGGLQAGLAYKSVSGVYVYAASFVQPVTPANGWVTLSLSFDAPTGFIDTSHTYADGAVIMPDPKMGLEIDVIVLAGSAPSGTADVSIDTIGISANPGSSDGGGASDGPADVPARDSSAGSDGASGG